MTSQEFLARFEESKAWESDYELDFARTVLAGAKGVDFECVTWQTVFIDSRGRRRRIDFAIQEGRSVQLALEVDGFDKTGRGSGMNRTEFQAWSERDLELGSRGWRVLHFANSLVKRQPDRCVRMLELALQEARGAVSGKGLSPYERRELAELETMQRSALFDLQQATQKLAGESRRISERLAWFGAAAGLALVVRGVS